MMRKRSCSAALWLVVVTLMLVGFKPGTSEAADEAATVGKTRAEVYAEMESTLGLVPTFFKTIPDATLELEWELMKRVQMAPGPIPNKYRELIGVAVSAATKCRYCIYFHTEFARLNGATDAEIEDALHFVKSTTGWSTYINGSQLDLETFKSEINAIVEHVKKQSAEAKAEGASTEGDNTADNE